MVISRIRCKEQRDDYLENKKKQFRMFVFLFWHILFKSSQCFLLYQIFCHWVVLYYASKSNFSNVIHHVILEGFFWPPCLNVVFSHRRVYWIVNPLYSSRLLAFSYLPFCIPMNSPMCAQMCVKLFWYKNYLLAPIGFVGA